MRKSRLIYYLAMVIVKGRFGLETLKTCGESSGTAQAVRYRQRDLHAARITGGLAPFRYLRHVQPTSASHRKSTMQTVAKVAERRKPSGIGKETSTPRASPEGLRPSAICVMYNPLQLRIEKAQCKLWRK